MKVIKEAKIKKIVKRDSGKVKGGRGRGRVNELPDDLASIDLDNIRKKIFVGDVAEKTSGIKRGRGRPKLTVDNQKPSKKSPKKRGRPSKKKEDVAKEDTK